ncbi:MAG TPA: Hsp70 family protein [Micavibrio sp.]|nr:Hsp70 family protein [Micavibrio sp.]
MPDIISCGIDFGTSNSTAAVSMPQGKMLVPLEGGKTTLPSAIFFVNKSTPVFGREAISSYLQHEDGRLLRGLKKILGTSLMEDKTSINGKWMPFTEVLKTFIDHLKTQADTFSDKEIKHVVMGRPVYFHDGDENADKLSQDTLETIAKASGFKHVEFLYEPIAAAFSHESNVEEEKLSLVIDLGGGTSDFTVIRISRNRMNKPDRKNDILATTGVRIGGTTFDYRLSLKNFMPQLGLGSLYRDTFDKNKLLPAPAGAYHRLSDWAMVNFAQTKKALDETVAIRRKSVEAEKMEKLYKLQKEQLGHALLEQVEKSKIALSKFTEHEAVFKAIDCLFSVTRYDFETAIHEDVERIFLSVKECLSQAGVTQEDIELIILTGGSTELPVINGMVQSMFPKAALSQGNKLDSVGLGLAYRAGAIF